ncbi:ABC transporter permease subunit [candidate division KSB1 bacterium]|nr:ABC transporter permease subunit [candidate division KSB1 bacterium]
MRKIRTIIRKEFLQIRRDRAMIAIIFVVPVIQLILLGYVISSEVKNLQTVICDLDKSPLSRELISRVKNSNYFIIAGYDDRYSRLEKHLDSGRAHVVVIVPSHFGRDIRLGRETSLQILLDGQDTNSATIALGYLNAIISDFGREKLSGHLQRLPIRPVFIDLETRYWYNPELEYSDYMVPGIAAFLLTMITTLLSAMGLVREREIGTLEQLSVTPIKKHQLLIGKIIPFAVLGFLELGIALAFAKIWYDIPLVGNLGIFALFTLIYLLTTLGLGLLISASSHTQQQALFMSWFFMVFALLMSGFIFPIENMPPLAQVITYLNPMRYFILVVREILIKGAGLQQLYQQGLVLVVFGVLIFGFAVMRYQERLKE